MRCLTGIVLISVDIFLAEKKADYQNMAFSMSYQKNF